MDACLDVLRPSVQYVRLMWCDASGQRRCRCALGADTGRSLSSGRLGAIISDCNGVPARVVASPPPPIDQGTYCSSTALDAAAPVLAEIVSTLASLDVGVEQFHAESGPGQFEVATAPAEALAAADALLFSREGVAAVAAKHGLVASFLPKLLPGAAGSGQHLHFSIWDEQGSNLLFHEPPRPRAFVFAGSEEPAVPGLSQAGEAFMAGVLRRLPALVAFTTPSPNSYRRMQPQCWAGAYQCYGINNREAALRLCCTPGLPDSANCELKAFDATANPHIGVAATIVAGLMGIKEGLRLPQPVTSDPGAMTGAVREGLGIARLPATLGEAIAAYEADEDFQAALASTLGSRTLPRAFIATRRSEWQHFGEMPLEAEAAKLYARY